MANQDQELGSSAANPQDFAPSQWQSLIDLLSPKLVSNGFELFDLNKVANTFEVYVYEKSPAQDVVDGQGASNLSISLEKLEEATGIVSAFFDDNDPVAGNYTLEVSSPGIERKLRTHEHFIGAIGETVNIKVNSAILGEFTFEGALEQVTTSAITINQTLVVTRAQRDAGLGSRLVEIAFANIKRSNSVYVWDGQAKKTLNPKGPNTGKVNASSSSGVGQRTNNKETTGNEAVASETAGNETVASEIACNETAASETTGNEAVASEIIGHQTTEAANVASHGSEEKRK